MHTDGVAGLSNATAFATAPAPARHLVGVHFVERVATFAMGLSHIASANSVAAKDVFTDCDRLHVGRVHTTRVPTQMVNGQASGDRPEGHFIGNAVGSEGQTDSGLNAPVPAVDLTREPRPTGIRSSGSVTLRPQAISDWRGFASHPLDYTAMAQT